ncbi:NADP-dependent oxidoreductase [Rhodococcus sp. ARC_M5]|uniref:NADP-dependent oxidoreductase n=2 Tax=unclassified Rhodococcus (in: high G+C Gram-positive bacteria) TaxID=192944 RepID=UPI001FB46671|nr:NADP-dependent oxidoreductase [Rhodococcus sp. ARC_M5]MCJ0894622.1 NADP-dependent oxidoreductase [Rhodococcus sp. ARC_M5]
MKAISQTTFGDPSVLQIVEIDAPVPIPTEVLIRVAAVGLNPVETAIRSGGFALLGEPPFVLGWDVSGVVESVVPGVTRFQVGDEVFGMPFFPRPASTYAELVVAPSRQIARKPRTLSFEQAAALPLAGLTAWQSVVDGAHVSPGQRVLVHGAGGGVGHLAVQIAKAFGAYVIGTASGPREEFVRGLGADEVIDYRTQDFTRAVSGVDIVLDCIGADNASRSLSVLVPGGTLVTIVDRSNRTLQAEVEQRGFTFVGISVEPDHVGLESLGSLVDEGKLVVHVDRTYAFEHIADAHRALDTSFPGKIVLIP